jgi:Cof subfamily protein (haloacid dehalogenase superfamily)
MIKAIFFDLDGTLLDSNKKILNSSIHALKKCQEIGIQLYVATARPPLIQNMLSLSQEEMGLFHGGVYCNGGCIRINDISEYMYIPEKVVNYCISQISKYEKLNISLQLKDEVHAFRFPLCDMACKKWGIEKKDVLELNLANKKETVKILIHYENVYDSVTLIPEELIHELNNYCSDKAKIYITDNGKVIQIINNNINKKESIEKIRRTLALDKSEIAVFGDDVNDIEMLSEYENSIAMGNAEDKVKYTAKMITKDNDSHGIEYALKDLLKII